MATDKLFYDYATHFTKAFAKFIGVAADEYEAKSLTLKETEKRPDSFFQDRTRSRAAALRK